MIQQVNTFQAVLATDGNRTYVMFIYDEIQWGSGSAGIGFNAGDKNHSFTLPRSPCGRNLSEDSNIRRPGTFIFRVDQNFMNRE
jgi:hypothetical protein